MDLSSGIKYAISFVRVALLMPGLRMFLGAFAVTTAIYLLRVVSWMLGTRLSAVIYSLWFFAIGYFGYHEWGELAAFLPWGIASGFLYYALFQPSSKIQARRSNLEAKRRSLRRRGMREQSELHRRKMPRR